MNSFSSFIIPFFISSRDYQWLDKELMVSFYGLKMHPLCHSSITLLNDVNDKEFLNIIFFDQIY